MTSAHRYSRENYLAWTWGIAALLVLLLLWLWITGRGLGTDCCGARSAASSAASVAPAATAPATPTATAATTTPAPAPAAATPAITTAAAEPPAAIPASKPIATLYFSAGKATAPSNTPELIAEVVKYLQQNPNSKAVISGYNDPSGNAALNAELSKNRAKAARAALQAAGIDIERIELRKPADTNLGGDLKQARRVDISVEP